MTVIGEVVANRAGKGSVWEREVAERLSLWWTQDASEPRTDVFWRIGGSGGRARIRGHKGKQTSGQHGDIAATDPIGDPLIQLVTIECKKGYNGRTVQDLLDKPDTATEQVYEGWIRKAEESGEQSGSYYWMIIVRRDRREPIVLLPMALASVGLIPKNEIILHNMNLDPIGVVTLEEFFRMFSPDMVKALVMNIKNIKSTTEHWLGTSKE